VVHNVQVVFLLNSIQHNSPLEQHVLIPRAIDIDRNKEYLLKSVSDSFLYW